MTVYVDQARNTFGRMVMSHMIADTLPELHAMAERIGMKRAWFQGRASFPHYDVAQGRKAAALAAGAIEVDRSTLAQHMKRLRQDPAFMAAWIAEVRP